MSDRELLEKAAKAAGIELEGVFEEGTDAGRAVRLNGTWWAPLHDDGDALRLAVKLGFAIRVLERCAFVESDPETLLAFSSVSELEMFNGDPYAATRRAIVRAAASLGEKM